MKTIKRCWRKLRSPHGIVLGVLCLGLMGGTLLAIMPAPLEALATALVMAVPMLGAVISGTDVIEEKREKAELLKTLARMLDVADREKRALTSAEKTEYKRLEDRADKLDKDILDAEEDLERRRRLAGREIERRSNPNGRAYHSRDPHSDLADVDPENEFRNVGEFFYAMAKFKRDHVTDQRLELREQTMGTGSQGGFALPTQFDSTLRQVIAQEGIVRSRATIIPAGDPPDARFEFPSLDQTSAQNMYGGVTLVHTGEGVTMTETTAKLREVSLEPKEISAYLVCTNKLLNNWDAAGAFFGNTLSSAMVGQEDYDFCRGNGVNKALGYINSAAAIVYARAGANAISFADTYNMLARALMRGGSYIWLASQTVIPQLAAMVDAGNHSVWLGSARGEGLAGAAGPLPSSLHGIPVVFSDRLPALGTKGDLSLVNLSYYLIKDGSGPFVASSEHILFLSNKTVFKIVWNVDAHPWLTEPLQLEGAAGNTVSPFVVLN